MAIVGNPCRASLSKSKLSKTGCCLTHSTVPYISWARQSLMWNLERLSASKYLVYIALSTQSYIKYSVYIHSPEYTSLQLLSLSRLTSCMQSSMVMHSMCMRPLQSPLRHQRFIISVMVGLEIERTIIYILFVLLIWLKLYWNCIDLLIKTESVLLNLFLQVIVYLFYIYIYLIFASSIDNQIRIFCLLLADKTVNNS